jgi:hypothetical protein
VDRHGAETTGIVRRSDRRPERLDDSGGQASGRRLRHGVQVVAVPKITKARKIVGRRVPSGPRQPETAVNDPSVL